VSEEGLFSLELLARWREDEAAAKWVRINPPFFVQNLKKMEI